MPATYAILGALAIVFLVFAVVCIFAALVLRAGHPKSQLWAITKGIAMFPVFLISWVPITLISLFKSDTTWEEIRHTRSIGLSELGS